MVDPQQQLTYFRQAVDILGGQNETARLLPMGNRNMRKFYAGQLRLHVDILAEMSRLLLERAAAIHDIERRLSPAFRDSLTEPQRDKPAHGNVARWKERRTTPQATRYCRDCGLGADQWEHCEDKEFGCDIETQEEANRRVAAATAKQQGE
jgi:hypothetical protein